MKTACGCVWEREDDCVDITNPDVDWAVDGLGRGWIRTSRCEDHS